MEEKRQNHIESACCAVMHFLGSAARSIRDGFYYSFPFMRSKETEGPEERLAPKASIVRKSAVGPAQDIAAVPVRESLSPKPQAREVVEEKEIPEMAKGPAIDTDSFFRGIEFENELERVKAEVFVKDFQSPSAETRTEALKRLKEISKPAAVAVLKKLLSSKENLLQTIEVLNALSSLNEDSKLKRQIFKDFLKHHSSSVRQAAVRALARYRDEESFSILSSSLEDGDSEVRRQTLNCISWFFRDRCAPAVLKSLHDVEYNVRKTGILICGVLKLPQSISALITLLSDPDKEIQKNAVASLRKITGQDFGFKLTGPEKKREAAIEDWRFWWRDNQAKFNM